MKGARSRPRTRLCPLQLSARLLQQGWKGVPVVSALVYPPQLQGVGLGKLLELLETKLDPESSRSENSAVVERSREQGLGWDLESPGERRGGCIGFHRAKTLCELLVRKTGLAIAGVEQEQGNPTAGACAQLQSQALLHLPILSSLQRRARGLLKAELARSHPWSTEPSPQGDHGLCWHRRGLPVAPGVSKADREDTSNHPARARGPKALLAAAGARVGHEGPL